MTPFRVVFVSSAAKDCRKLDETILPRVRSALEALADDPLAGKPLQGPYKGLRSFRVGEYRIVYRPDSASRSVVVYAIGHRRDIYR